MYESLLKVYPKVEYEVEKLRYYLKPMSSECKKCGSTDIIQGRWYLPDFKVGPGLFVEAKGRFTSKDRTKMIAVKEYNTGVQIHMVFMRDQHVRPGKPERYSDWCKKHGFTYSIGVDKAAPT